MLLAASLFHFVLMASGVTGFLNPIIPGVNPDPSITRKGDDYFLTTSSFEYLYVVSHYVNYPRLTVHAAPVYRFTIPRTCESTLHGGILTLSDHLFKQDPVGSYWACSESP